MSDSTDVVVRLKQARDNLRAISPLGNPSGASLLFGEASDEIERLRAGGCARDQRTTQYCAEAETLGGELERVKIALANAVSERDALRADVKKLKTLMKFAAILDQHEGVERSS